MRRRERTRGQEPRSVPWPLDGESDVVAVGTTWGLLQGMHAAPRVPTVGDLELAEMVQQGAVVVDCRTAGSFGGRAIPGWVHIPHDEIVDRRDEIRPGSDLPPVLQRAPVSTVAARDPPSDGSRIPGRGSGVLPRRMHDWVTLAMPTDTRED